MSLAKVDVLLGPPGTGKTTALLGRIERLLAQGVRPEEIAFVSYTNAATTEAIERAAKKFDLDPEQFPWFRTIHSMAYRAYRAMGERIEVMQPADWKDFGTSCSYQFDDGPMGMDGTLNFADDGDCLRSIDSLARSKRCSIERAILHAGEVPSHITTEMVELFRARLTAWKRDNKKIDFQDMLERALVTDWRPPVRFAFADEAQDNSRIQNSLLRHWFLENERCESLTYAGDDDQGIYGWSGAEPMDFVWLARHARTQILSQSYRIPATVHRVAQSIIGQNKDRVPKVYAPRDEEGQVLTVDSATKAVGLASKANTLCLVRCVRLATDVRGSCLESGTIFHSEVGSFSPFDRKGPRGAFDTISAWRRGENATATGFRALLSEIPSGKGDDRILPLGVKAKADKNSDFVPVWRARDEFKIARALETILGPHPFDLLLKTLSAEERAYMAKVHSTDPGLKGPTVTITTKHRSKGREAENVVVLSNIGARFARRRDNSRAGYEEENCVAYVAVTRTKSSLFIVAPTERDYYDYASHVRVA